MEYIFLIPAFFVYVLIGLGLAVQFRPFARWMFRECPDGIGFGLFYMLIWPVVLIAFGVFSLVNLISPPPAKRSAHDQDHWGSE